MTTPDPGLPPDDVTPSRAEQLAEDLTDLTRRVDLLAATVEDVDQAVTELATVLPGTSRATTVPPSPSAFLEHSDAQDHGPEEDDGQEEEPPPRFIVLLPDWEEELAELAQWVHGVLVTFYLGETSQRRRWCAQWWEHREAIARLHAAWMAWQELTHPDAGGHTGPSVWHRDHLDDALTHLTDPDDGPFAGCSADPDRPFHVLPATRLITPIP